MQESDSIRSRIGKTWLTRIVNDFDRDKFVDYIIQFIAEEEEFIEEQKEKFIFSATEECRIKAKLEFTVNEILSLLDFHLQNDIKIGVPILIIEEPKIEITVKNKKIKELIENWKEENRELLCKRVFNLLDGTSIDTNYQQDSSDHFLFRLRKLIEIDQIKLPNQLLQIPLWLLPFLSIKNEIKESFALAFIKKDSLNKIFKEKIKRLEDSIDI